MLCTVKHRPLLKCGKNTASMLTKTQATSSTYKLRVIVRAGNLTQDVNCAHETVITKMEMFKGCCLKHQIRTILRFFLEFFSPLSDTTTPLMRLCFSGSIKVVSEGDYCILFRVYSEMKLRKIRFPIFMMYNMDILLVLLKKYQEKIKLVPCNVLHFFVCFW